MDRTAHRKSDEQWNHAGNECRNEPSMPDDERLEIIRRPFELRYNEPRDGNQPQPSTWHVNEPFSPWRLLTRNRNEKDPCRRIQNQVTDAIDENENHPTADPTPTVLLPLVVILVVAHDRHLRLRIRF